MPGNIFSAPKFEDQEQNDTAAQLWAVVRLMALLSLIYVVAWLALAPQLSLRIVYALPLFPLFAWLFHLLRRGRVNLAASLLVAGLWAILFIAASFSGGVLAPGYSGLLLTVLAAGIFMSPAWALRFVWLSVISGAALVLLERRGMLLLASEFTDSTAVWIAQAIYFFVAASLLNMATTRISQSFQRVQHEIEERKKAESALRDAELLYRTLVEQTSVIIYRDEVEEGGPSIFISPQIKDMIGYTAEEFSTDPLFWHSLIHPDDKDRTLETVHQIVTMGENKISEYRLMSKNGDWVWIRDEAVLIRGDNGKSLYVQGVYINITEQKRISEQREGLIRELEAKNSELERFTYTVSHDLKSPLITMAGFLGYLEKDAMNGNLAQFRKDINRITEANLKMQKLLNELLELSRIGRLMNPSEAVPFELIVEDALSRVEGRLKDGRIRVVVRENLPTAHGDRARLVEVMQNLVDNAAKFMGSQPNPEIKIGASEADRENQFFVKDNGMGIDPAFHEKIFGLFDKLDPKIEGTGIGLALVRRIIEVHGGKIRVESEIGMGTTFFFTLPAAK